MFDANSPSMKVLPKKLLPLTLFAIAVTSLFSVQPAQAYTITLEQMGPNVVANGSGAINLTGLTFIFGATAFGNSIQAIGGYSTLGAVPADLSRFSGFSGPTSFGSGGVHFANTGSGDFVGVNADGGVIVVPHGYVSVLLYRTA